MKKVLAVMIAFALFFTVLCACSSQNKFTSSDSGTQTADKTESKTDENESKNDSEKTSDQSNNQEDTDMEHTKVKFTMENGGEFVMELYPEYAPETVANFKKLVSEGFYDGLIFHRVIAGFMAQGGDPTGTGYNGSGKTIKGEFSSNGFAQNTLSHQRGVVSMARSPMPDSASSQFFICFGDESFLDGDYAAFGKVIEGMEVVDTFAEIETNSSDRPLEDIVIKTAVIVK